jgi:rSAM/selenodomain-associated transferase 1
MRNILLLFVKAPAPGKVKVRMTPPLAPEEAAGLYRAFVEDLLERTAPLEEKGVERVCAYEPAPDFPDLSWIKVPHPRLYFQRGGTVEEHFIRAFDQAFSMAPGGRVVAMASDIPLLPLEYVHLSFKLLDTREAVLGPTSDGGCYLMGLQHRHPDAFKGIPWSTERVFSKAKESLSAHGLPYDTLPPYYDVDTPEDLTRLARDILAKNNGCPRTRKALERLKLLG